MSFLYHLVVFLVSLIVFFGAGFLITKICKILYRSLVPLKKRKEISADIKRIEDEERMSGKKVYSFPQPFSDDIIDDIVFDSTYAGCSFNVYYTGDAYYTGDD